MGLLLSRLCRDTELSSPGESGLWGLLGLLMSDLESILARGPTQLLRSFMLLFLWYECPLSEPFPSTRVEQFHDGPTLRAFLAMPDRVVQEAVSATGRVGYSEPALSMSS